uniref:Uncharacterized protein n=1 Tax=Electrophorus electricus TaxID=8005 RepID=A0A4W4FMY9_ELEEL
MKTSVHKVLFFCVLFLQLYTIANVCMYVILEKKVDSRRTFTLQDYFNSSIKARSYNLLWLSGETVHSSQHPLRTLILQYHTVAFIFDLDPHTNYAYFITADIPQEIQYLAWSPTGHKLAFVWKYNVYVKASPNSPLQQVTTDGQMNVILNGIPDWVYEEEMFSSNYALWWSPTGKYLAFAKFNDTNVHTIEYPWYGEGQYPETIYIPYPKSGTPNPTVRLLVVDTANVSNITEVVVPSPSFVLVICPRDHYLSTVTWVTDERIAVQWQNRTQTGLSLCSFLFTYLCIFQERNLMSQTGWVGRFSPIEPVFRPDGSSYYLIMSDAKGFKHLHHISEDTATPITSGKWEVTNILKVTKDAVISIEGSNYSQRVCLTCTLMEDRCKYNSAYFSHDGTYYRMGCSGASFIHVHPPYRFILSSFFFPEVRVLEDNTNLDSILQGIAMPTVTHGTLKIGEFELWYQMTLPPNLDKSKKYPLLIDVYAGPCSQKSDFRFQTSWSTYLASTENIIVASFDGRGSGFQGDDIMHAIYRHLGTYEVEDQITAARHLIDLGYIDKNKIAIWGWSYGGYVTSMVLGAGSGVFKCGMAVAPVSKWEYYDSIYTERYMLTPSENQALYDNSTVTSRAKNFKSVQYLLVHGTADDNVHFQQAAQISKALVDQQIDFDSMWYTDKDHGLGGSANQHVYTHLSHFLKDCFA